MFNVPQRPKHKSFGPLDINKGTTEFLGAQKLDLESDPRKVLSKTWAFLALLLSQSLNLSSLNYPTWSIVESKACHVTHPNLNSLKDSTKSVWASMSKDLFRVVGSGLRSRIRAMLNNRCQLIKKKVAHGS